MRIAFMGTPEFALIALKHMVHAGFSPAVVYTQPPRERNRGQKLQKTAVHVYAEENGFAVRHPHNLRRDDQAIQEFQDLNLDVAVVAAYGLILPKLVLEAPKFGCINIHGSILPRWRGAAPIHRAIEAGDKETGITIMHMDEGLDTGDMISVHPTPIHSHDTALSLHDRMAAIGGRAIVDTLKTLEKNNELPRQKQPKEGVEYAHKVDKSEGQLKWTQSADMILSKVRAFNPHPGTWFEHNGERFKVLEVDTVPYDGDQDVGVVLDDELTIRCSLDAIRIKKIQRSGKKPTDTEDFLRGFDIPPGTDLDQ